MSPTARSSQSCEPAGNGVSRCREQMRDLPHAEIPAADAALFFYRSLDKGGEARHAVSGLKNAALVNAANQDVRIFLQAGSEYLPKEPSSQHCVRIAVSP